MSLPFPQSWRGEDAVGVEVIRHLFTAVAEEMGATLRRTASSPNIKERRDYSCAVFTPGGETIAQGDHMPVHLGAMPRSVAATLKALGPLEQGDVAILNDPFEGGTHLPDLTMVAPVDTPLGSVRLGYVASRAHHADVGGMSPGSMPIAREIFQEGLRIPPVLLIRQGSRVNEVWRLILANVRTPAEREGDLEAQLGSLQTGIRRLHEMAERRGPEALLGAQAALLAYGDRLVREGIRLIPDGRWSAEDHLDSDGTSDMPVPIRVALVVDGDRIQLDFSGSAPQTAGGVNAVAAVTESAARYVLRCVLEDLLAAELPAGGGSMATLELVLPPASVVNASPPAAVAGGNVETSQRIVDVLFRAFGGALPERMPALSQGTMNNLTIGGMDPRTGQGFAYYETLGGGMGAGPGGPGLSGVHVHMSNTLNTPIEVLEHAYPLRVLRYGLRRGSGGRGRHSGGDGICRDLEFLAPAEVTILSDRRSIGPAGHLGGASGAPGENVWIRRGEASALSGKVTFRTEAGDIVSVRSPGGGGWGSTDG